MLQKIKERILSGGENSTDEALELAQKVDSDVVLATDPDADRLGIFAKDTKTGKYMEYTGNMS